MADAKDFENDERIQHCPKCGKWMHAIRGSKKAICSNCGYKEACC